MRNDHLAVRAKPSAIGGQPTNADWCRRVTADSVSPLVTVRSRIKSPPRRNFPEQTRARRALRHTEWHQMGESVLDSAVAAAAKREN